MDYDLIEKMKVEELKNYLRVRGLLLNGRKKELVARVFSAMENNVQPIKTAAEVEHQLSIEYKTKLKIDGLAIPDPYKIPHGWLNEDEGMSFWPMLMYPDIFNYLMFYPAELGSKDLNDYKNSKAYSYYKSGWLKPLLYHELSGSKFCLFKGECRKSQSIHDPYHALWLVIEKKNVKIRACHCTCMAGMGQSCNHVAAAMYRIEAAVRLGLTKPSCTSKANEWLPSRQDVAPTKIKNLDFSRENFAQRGKQKRPLVHTTKEKYNPLALTHIKQLTLNDIAAAIEDVVPESILFTAVPKPEVDFFRESLETENEQTKPQDLISIDDIILMSSNKSEFIEHMKNMVKRSQSKEITRGQAANKNWFLFRKAVITASKAHDVLSKMKRVAKGGGGYIDMWALNQKVSGLTFVDPNIPALKYGRTMESDAVNTFYSIFKSDHKDVVFSECGLYLDSEIPFRKSGQNN